MDTSVSFRWVLGLFLVLALASQTGSAAEAPGEVVTVPLCIHVAEDQVGPVADRRWIGDVVRTANAEFALFGVRVEVRETLSFPGVEVSTAEQADLLASRLRQGALNLFLVRTLHGIEGSRKPITGVCWHLRSNRRIGYLIISRPARADALAHEAAHYFGIGHSQDPSNLVRNGPGFYEWGKGLSPEQGARIRARARKEFGGRS